MDVPGHPEIWLAGHGNPFLPGTALAIIFLRQVGKLRADQPMNTPKTTRSRVQFRAETLGSDFCGEFILPTWSGSQVTVYPTSVANVNFLNTGTHKVRRMTHFARHIVTDPERQRSSEIYEHPARFLKCRFQPAQSTHAPHCAIDIGCVSWFAMDRLLFTVEAPRRAPVVAVEEYRCPNCRELHEARTAWLPLGCAESEWRPECHPIAEA